MADSATLKPENVARDLRELWTQMAEDQAESGGVLKACAMTLVVLAKDDADAGNVRQTIGVLMHEHPSRAIVIRANQGPELDAQVFAECWKPFGKNQQICSEGIEITSGPGGLEEVVRFILPLRVPDLPVVLWCRGALDQTYMYRKRFLPLFALADKIIFDSRDVLDAEAGVEFLRGLRAPNRHIADLHWARLTGWREVVAHLFDDQAMRPGDVKSAEVRYGGESVTTCALYLASWVRSALPQVKVAIEREAAKPGLSSITFHSASDSLRVAAGGDSCLKVEGCGRNYRTALPPSDEESLMQQELKILGADKVWDRVLDA